MMKNCLPKILLTGANGQLGQMMKARAPKDFELIAYNRQEFNVTNFASVVMILNQLHPDVVVNAAAYTAVDKAEDEPELAREVNFFGAENLAKACEQLAIPLIHISTDYVFPGQQLLPQYEEDPVAPVNQYGVTKSLGEQAIQKHCSRHIILRVCAIFSEFGINFYKTILRLAQERRELRIVADQITCPTYAGDIAEAIYSVCRQLTHFGIYHFCSSEQVSWYDFANAIIEAKKEKQPLLLETITAITAQEFAAKAPRPQYSKLNCDKIARDYGIAQPNWKNHLCL